MIRLNDEKTDLVGSHLDLFSVLSNRSRSRLMNNAVLSHEMNFPD